MHKNTLFVHAMNVVQIASRLMIKDRRSSHQGCFDDGSRSLELGSKNDAASLPEDCRLDRRCCDKHLNYEYRDLARAMTGVLCRKRPSPVASGQPRTWACGIVYVLGRINFLSDKSFSPHMTTADLCAAFDVGESTVHAKARAIEKAIGVGPFDPQWTLPSLVEKNPLFWMAEVNGLLVDLRDMPREIQEIAFQDRLIPYIPADPKERS